MKTIHNTRKDIKRSTWVFYNHTTEKRIETENLAYLLSILEDRFGYVLPRHLDIDLLLHGYIELNVLSDNQTNHFISIGEDNSTLGISFDTNMKRRMQGLEPKVTLKAHRKPKPDRFKRRWS